MKIRGILAPKVRNLGLTLIASTNDVATFRPLKDDSSRSFNQSDGSR